MRLLKTLFVWVIPPLTIVGFAAVAWQANEIENAIANHQHSLVEHTHEASE